MNKFATLKCIGSFSKVCFYSILFEDNSLTMYEEFYNSFEANNETREGFDLIISQIKVIGERGALPYYFRHEGGAEALPVFEFGLGKTTLRLYCIRISDEVVILLNGGIKTTQKAQHCPNVSQHFALANKVSKLLTQAIKEKEIAIDQNMKPRLSINADFVLEL